MQVAVRSKERQWRRVEKSHMKSCPDHNLLQHFIDGELDPMDFASVDQHVDSCLGCQSILVRLTENDPAASDSLPNCVRHPSGDDLPTGLLNRLASRVAEACNHRPVKTASESVRIRHESGLDNNTPRQLGDYRIIREIGRGGMGIVYEAEQKTLGRSVALKVLPQRMFQSKSAVARFQREAAAAAILHHTNIVPVYEAGVDNGIFFFAMQLIHGDGLDVVRDEIRKSRSQAGLSTDAAANLPTRSQHSVDETNIQKIETSSAKNQDNHRNVRPDTATRIPPSVLKTHYRFVADVGRQTASALEHAHERGIIHRDVKPSNLILGANGIVWLADFGLAKQFDDGLTRTADAPGTLRYMSPERFRGQTDRTSDVYSLGASLYELLTLEPAFSAADQMSMLDQIKNLEPKMPTAFDRRIPIDLQTIILKAMAKEPTKRYPTALAMEEDLARFLNGEPIQARRISITERTLRWAKKHQALAAALVALTLLLFATSIGASLAAFSFRNQKNEQTELANNNLRLAKEKIAESKNSITQRDSAHQNAYFADIQFANQNWQTGNIFRMLEILRRYVPDSGPVENALPDVRNWEWYFLMSRANLAERTFDGFQQEVLKLRWNQDGERIIGCASDGTLRICNAQGMEIEKINSPGIIRFALSSDQQQVATIDRDRKLKIWNLSDQTLVREIEIQLPSLTDVDWSLEGDRIAVVSDETSSPKIIWTDDWEVSELPQEIRYADRVRFSRNGKLLLVGTRLWSFAENRIIQSTHAAAAYDFHPQRDLFFMGTFNKGVIHHDLAARADLSVETVVDASATAIRFSPDGTRFLVGANNGSIRLFDYETNEQINEFFGHLGRVNSLDWHPDGERFASAGHDGTIKFWNANPVGAGAEDGPAPLTQWHESDAWSYRSVTGNEGEILNRQQSVVAKIPFPVFQIVDYPEWKRSVFVSSTYGAPHQNLRRMVIFNTDDWRQTENVDGVPFFADDKMVAFVSGKFEVINFRNGQRRKTNVGTFQTGTSPAKAISNDGSKLATGLNGEISIWDLSTGLEIDRLYGHQPDRLIHTIAWSPSGQTLASGGWDQNVVVWDVATGSQKFTLRGHLSGVTELYFSEDESRLASVGNQIKIWNVQTGREVMTVPAFSGFRDLWISKSLHEQVSESTSTLFEAVDKANRIAANNDAIQDFQRRRQFKDAQKLALRPESDSDDAQRAQWLALKLIASHPEYSEAHGMLAVAYYRSGLWQLAYDASVRSIKLKPESVAPYGFIAAMSQWQLSQKVAAREWLEKSNRQLERSRQIDFETELLKHECHRLMLPQLNVTNQSMTIKVDTLTDEADATSNGRTSLREALIGARAGDEVEITVPGTLELSMGQLHVDKSIRIQGAGSGLTTIDGLQKSRILKIDDGLPTASKVGVRELTLINGHANGENDAARDRNDQGGGIYCVENLVLTRVKIDGCYASVGGGLYGAGGTFIGGKHINFRIQESTICNNNAREAGAMMADRWTSVTMQRCTVSGNSGQLSGAISQMGLKLRLEDCTFSSNRGWFTSTLRVMGVLQIVRTTITDNHSRSREPAIYRLRPWTGFDNSTLIENSIISGNTADGAPADLYAPPEDAQVRHSLIGSSFFSPIAFAVNENNLFGVDPLLGPLADNGGPTATHALQEDSPAIDAGSSNLDRSIRFDQRGDPYLRVVDGDAKDGAELDIGSFEKQ